MMPSRSSSLALSSQLTRLGTRQRCLFAATNVQLPACPPSSHAYTLMPCPLQAAAEQQPQKPMSKNHMKKLAKMER